MYFSQNKKSYGRAEEYRRRTAGVGASTSDDAVPTFYPSQEMTPPPSVSPSVTSTPETTGSCPVKQFPSLAMVYSPKQCFEGLYEPEEALSRGTLFAALYLPFEGRRVTKR